MQTVASTGGHITDIHHLESKKQTTDQLCLETRGIIYKIHIEFLESFQVSYRIAKIIQEFLNTFYTLCRDFKR